MNRLFLIVAYDSWANKPIKRVFRTPNEALTFSTTVSDSKCTILQGEDYVTIFNDYLKNEGGLIVDDFEEKQERYLELKRKADTFTNDLDFKNWSDFGEYSELLDIFEGA